MKSLAPFFIVIATTIFSFDAAAQPSRPLSDRAKMSAAQTTLEEVSDDQLSVLYYHVEERINMNFGSSITTYNVSSLSLVSTNDLGENNTRIITPKYGKAKIKVRPVLQVASMHEAKKLPVASIEAPINSDKIAETVSLKKLKYVDIDIIGTYERVIDKGYKSVDMLKKVGNSRFFGGDLTIAAKWYNQLFSMTTDLEAEYYYRYSQALFSIHENEKANEMLHQFESKRL
ncbi:hypothetical protein [Flavobacterium sp.]|uniref:hypothetical protein n=1 Tax=Flavobacterium sp. TaxID=239 RepID=UPI00262803DE|nr:hypothetical protein [Flavobacterium sp.]